MILITWDLETIKIVDTIRIKASSSVSSYPNKNYHHSL